MPIYYTGIGAKRDGIHTEYEFHQIMIREFIQTEWRRAHIRYYLNLLRENNINVNLPDNFALFNIDNWIDFSGAIRI